MTAYILSRLIAAAFVLLGVSTLVFLMIHWIPGDPVMVMLGESATPAEYEALRQSLNLHLPIWQQWWHYLAHLLQGDLGQSLHSGKSIVDMMATRIPVTAVLALAALCFSLIMAIPVGILSALYATRWQDKTLMLVSLAGICIPNFWLGPMLVMFFSLYLGILPSSGNDHWYSIILPALTLGTAMAAIQARMIRASLLEVLQQQYILTARSRGLAEITILFRHAFRNALLPTVTIIGMQVGALLTGAVVTEQIFAWPGIGQLIIESIEKRDYPLVQACVLLISGVYVIVNLATDLIYAWIDPRIRLHSS